jgi:tRNA G46 methylase TrmB
MIQDRFLADCQRVLIPSGEVRVVTDHAPYWAWMREHFDRWTTPAVPAESPSGRPFREAPFTAPPSAREGEMVGTNFERKYRLNPGSGGGGTDFFATTLINA